MATEFMMNSNEFLPLREVVYLTLRKAILKGELKPGERLMEIAQANRLGVSRTPIREAIRKLENEGLVTMVPRRGAQVAQITQEELNNVLEVRTSLEVLAASCAAKRITPEMVEELQKGCEHFRLLTATSTDLTELAEADVAFHDIIYRATFNRRLIQILNNLREQMYRFRVEYLKDPAVRSKLADEHRSITEAILAGNVEEAQRVTAEHINNQRISIHDNLGEMNHGA